MRGEAGLLFKMGAPFGDFGFRLLLAFGRGIGDLAQCHGAALDAGGARLHGLHQLFVAGSAED